jgi:hypothetical protein
VRPRSSRSPRLEAFRLEAGRFGRCAGDENLADPSERGKTRRGVHGVSERREVERFVFADRPDVRRARVHACADGKPAGFVVVARAHEQLTRRGDRFAGVIGTHEARNEKRDELVAGELVDDSVPNVDRGGRLSIEPRHQSAELLRADALGERSRPADIGEKKRSLHLGTARPLPERVCAAAADPAVDTRRAEAEEAQDVARPPERRVTQLATRIRGDRAADPPHGRIPAEVATPLTRQDATPFLIDRDLRFALERARLLRSTR